MKQTNIQTGYMESQKMLMSLKVDLKDISNARKTAITNE